jgi:cytochrome bd-type quinol oxidase subunit 2
MQRPERITITSFWLDWLLLPIMVGAAWLTLRWALADFRLASNLSAEQAALPVWAVSIPLVISAAGWVILGLGSLIREEYWEHRIWCCILALWSLCCLVGAVLILLSFLSGGGGSGIAGILNLVGLTLTALMLTVPALMEVPLRAKAVFPARGPCC